MTLGGSRDQKLSDQLVALAHSRWIIPALLLVAIIETCSIPFPYEAVFVALCLAARDRIATFIIVSTLGSAIGGSIIYLVGAHLFDPVIAYLGLEPVITEYLDRFEERGASFIFLGGATPAPSFAINMIAGATGYPFLEFFGIFSASRLARFAILGGLLYLFGGQITQAWSKLPKWVRRLLTVIVIAAIVYWFVSGLRP